MKVNFSVFALSYLVFEGNFPSTNTWGAYIWRGDLTEGFLRYRFGGLYLEGLIHGGAYFRNFTVYLSIEKWFLLSFSMDGKDEDTEDRYRLKLEKIGPILGFK